MLLLLGLGCGPTAPGDSPSPETASDSADTASDSADTASDSADTAPDSADTAPDSADTASDTGGDTSSPGTEGWCDGDAFDAGLASWEASDGARSDLTTELSAGTADAPVVRTLDPGGTLRLCGGTWFVSLAGVDLTVLGHDGPTLDGGGRGRVLSAEGTLVLSGVNVSGGFAENGGGVWFAGGLLALDGVRFAGNTATGAGGGLYAEVDQLEAHGLSFVDNTAVLGGGGWLQPRAGEAAGARRWAWTESTFTGNTAEQFGGLGLVAEGEVLVTASGLTLADNVGASTGGGLGVVCGAGADCAVELSEATFTGDSTEGVGGGLYVEALGSASLSLSLAGVTLTGESAAGGGAIGVLAEHAGPVAISAVDLRIEGGAADNGAAVLVEAGATTVTVELGAGTVLSDNTASSRGGAVYVTADGPESVVALVGATVTANRSGRDGGALYIMDATTTCVGGAVTANVAGTTSGGWSLFDATLSASACDLGEGADDNLGGAAPDDVMGHTWGSGASFRVECARTSCTVE